MNFEGDLDPEIAALMGIEQKTVDTGNIEIKETMVEKPKVIPKFHELDLPENREKKERKKEQVDISKKEFEQVKTFFLKEPLEEISDKNYFKIAMDGEEESATRLNNTLQQFVKAKDAQEKAIFRGKLISAFWNYLEEELVNLFSSSSRVKILLYRFGLLSPALLKQDAKLLISHIIFDKNIDEPIYYFDEWLQKVATGFITPSASDETKQIGNKKSRNLDNQIQRTKASIESTKTHIRNKTHQREDWEKNLLDLVSRLCSSSFNAVYEDLIDSYNPAQKAMFSQMQTTIQNLKKIDQEISGSFKELDRYSSKLKSLKTNLAEFGLPEEDVIDNSILKAEFDGLRQMTKMCTGRQGNHVPILMSNYFVADKNNIATRENVLKILDEIEKIEPAVFQRTYKRELYRIPPYVILVPSYGDRGICWEPFEKFNRATSRGRIAIPMYPKNLKLAVITAVADLRWQTAKEKAAHYWMEEGITGGYYQWSYSAKLKGNLKEYFIRDYVLWISKESEGIQKLDKEVRAVFWRHAPFNQERKDMLRNRGYVYNELYKKDINRTLSDGY